MVNLFDKDLELCHPMLNMIHKCLGKIFWKIDFYSTDKHTLLMAYEMLVFQKIDVALVLYCRF